MPRRGARTTRPTPSATAFASNELTEPVVERYREEGRLVAVDGEQTVDEVAGAIEAALEQVGAQA